MSISFNGINESIVTFNTEGDIKPGSLVSISSNNTVSKSTSDATFIGVCISSKNNVAAVQIRGFTTIKMKTVGSTNYGLQYFVSDDDSSLKLSSNDFATAVPLNVVSIDKANSTIGVFL